MKYQKQFIELITTGLFCLTGISQATGLAEIYNIALDSDPALKQAIATQQSVSETAVQSYSAFLPNLSASATTSLKKSTNLSAGDDTYSGSNINLSLSQTLYDDKNYVTHQIAKLNISSANADLIKSKQDLMARVTNAYLDVLLAADTVEFSKAEKTAISRQLQQAKRRFEVGIIAITAVLNAQAGYDNATAAVLKAATAT